MTFKCCVPGCNNTGSKIFHSFPKEKVRCQRWICNTKCFYLNSETAFKTHHKVCKDHFAPNDYTSTMRKFLKSDAVPTVNLPVINEAQQFICSKNVYICCNAVGTQIQEDSPFQVTNHHLNECSDKHIALPNEFPVKSYPGHNENVFENLERCTKSFNERGIISDSDSKCLSDQRVEVQFLVV